MQARNLLLFTLLLPTLLLACVQERGSGGDDDDNGGTFNNSSSSNSGGSSQRVDRGDLKVSWEDGKNEDQRAFASWLQSTEFVEKTSDGFNRNFKLPYDINIIHRSCGIENAFYVPSERLLVMCYELVQSIYNTFANSGVELSEQDLAQVTLSTWIYIFFHEMGHALVDAYDLPIAGREEDAVDNFSTVLLIEAGLHEAVYYAAIFWYLIDNGMTATRPMLADEHSLNLQRFYNILCLIAGDDPEWSEYILANFPDMEERLPRCAAEYEQQSSAWMRLLEPWEK